MAKTKISFKQILLDSTTFQGSATGNVELKDNGVALTKLAALTAQNKVLGSPNGNSDPASISLTNDHLTSGTYSNIVGLGSPQSQALNMGNQKITNLATPIDGSDGANKDYVLQNGQYGIKWKAACRVATTANITIASDLNVGDTIDGVTLADGDRVLVMDQTTGSQNGIYIAGATPARAADLAAGADGSGVAVMVTEGGTNGDKGFLASADGAVAIGTNDPAFVLFTGLGTLSGSDGINVTGSALSLSNDGVTSSKLRGRREVISVDANIRGSSAGGKNIGTWDAGMVDPELSYLFLNGVLLRLASAKSKIDDGTPDGDYFIEQSGGDAKVYIADALLATNNGVDKVELRFIGN